MKLKPFLLLSLLAAFMSCKKGVDFSHQTIQFSRDSIKVHIGEQVQLEIDNVTSEESRTPLAYTYTSSNKDAVTISTSGKITAIANGNAVITAKSTPYGLTAKCTIKVLQVPINGMILSRDSIVLKEGDTTTIKATITPANTPEKGLFYSSLDTTIAKVNTNGLVTGISQGSTTIDVFSLNNLRLSTSCTIRVKGISELISANLGYSLLSGDVEQVYLFFFNNSNKDISITQITSYNTQGREIVTNIYNKDPFIIKPTKNVSFFSICKASIPAQEGGKRELVDWPAKINFDYDGKHYLMTVKSNIKSIVQL